MSYRSEFPDFGELDVALPEGFEDTSWYQDAMPSFTHDMLGIILMIDYAAPELRVIPDGCRFNLYSLDKYNEPIPDHAVLETDDFEEVLQVLTAVEGSNAA